MYEAMDSFLDLRTWSSRHEEDQRRFFRALGTIIDQREFNADAMGEYMRRKAAETITPDALDREVRYYVAAAWAVYRYRQTNS